MYKFKWAGERVDTIEYVCYETNDKGKKTGKVIISSTDSRYDSTNILKKLKYIPKEYKKIYGYDWFVGEE